MPTACNGKTLVIIFPSILSNGIQPNFLESELFFLLSPTKNNVFSGTIKSAIGLGILLNQGIGDTLRVSLSADPVEEIKVAKEILANFNLYDKPTLISCPTCGRIQYQMLDIVQEIEDFLEGLGNVKLKVAIMGCAVNGPQEAKEADIGIAGGKNGALLIKKGEIIGRIEEKDIIPRLKEEILKLVEH